MKADKKPPARGPPIPTAKQTPPQDAANARINPAGDPRSVRNLLARLNIIGWRLHAAGEKTLIKGVAQPDPAVIFPFEVSALTDGRLAR